MDGDSLAKSKAQWQAALANATETFRTLFAESSSKAWKPVPIGVSSSSPISASAHNSTTASHKTSLNSSPAIGSYKTKAREPVLHSVRSNGQLGSTSSSCTDHHSTDAPLPFALASLKPANVVVHRRSNKGPDIYRAVAEVSFDGEPDLTCFRSLLQTPETRPQWDRLVETAELLEQLDPDTRICKTNYRLGWPASPRDAITISRTMADDSMLIDVSTSLPRSPDAPAYLRPAPPCVRSHVQLMTWCIQLITSETATPSSSSSSLSNQLSLPPSIPRIRITVFWSWDLKGVWMGMPSGGLGTHLPDLIKGLVTQVKDKSTKLPIIYNYGSCVDLLSTCFDPSRDTLCTEYAIVVQDEIARQAEDRSEKDLDTLNRLRARRRLEAGIQFSLPAAEGWDVQVVMRNQTKSSHTSTWNAVAEQPVGLQTITLTLKHARMEDAEEIAKAKVKIQRVAASSGLRLNDSPFEITAVEPRTVAALSHPPMLEDVGSVSDSSVATSSTAGSSAIHNAGLMANASRGGTPVPGSLHAINALIRRNYIYFTSLLQEPEAKWKPITDTRGVTVTQLDSIDPTLVVYRAEATFVGVGVWDLFSAIRNPGVRAYWDKGLEDTVLLSDLNELSSLWHLKTKASWPMSARDSVTIQTAYKAPASVHVFSFSADDRNQFPAIPPVEPGMIRTQIDIRGWSVEALSPTTVHITMLEQSDPKGWTSKSSTPLAMVNAVAGVGEYAIKFGGPPVLTRLLGAQTRVSKYDHDKASFRIEYEATDLGSDANDAANVECEIRCDVETWAPSLDLVVDPPPISVSCLRRHKLSQGGGGLWLTIEHVAASLEDETAKITVRKGTSREKGSVFVNEAQMRVDVDQLKEDQVHQLARQKRTKPQRVPLDLTNPPPRLDARTPDILIPSTHVTDDSVDPSHSDRVTQTARSITVRPARTASPPPLTSTTNTLFSDENPRQPLTCALDVLFLLRRIHAERSPDPAGSPAGWSLVSERNGLYVRRKLMESISSTVVVQRGDKVVQGLSAEDLVDVVSSLSCRKQWDDKMDAITLLASYGNGASTSFITTKASFPFRGRAFHLASLTARAVGGSTAPSPSTADGNVSGSASSGPAVYFHASASFPQQSCRFPVEQLNPHGLPMGKVLIDGWILETLDPYNSTNFQIPSTRCTHVVAIDYAGSLPAAVNTMWNATLPKSILQIEEFLKARGSLPSVKTPPSCVQVLGDGRDEDQGFTWILQDPNRKQIFLSSTFDPSLRICTTMSMRYGSQHNRALQTQQPDEEALTRKRPVSVSDASTTKGSAMKAVSLASITPSASSHAVGLEDGSGLSRATSVASIASSSAFPTTPSRHRATSIRVDSRKASDLVLMEVEIELRHFSKGYDVQLFSEFLPMTATHDESTNDSPPQDVVDQPNQQRFPVDLAMAAKGKQDLPTQIKVYDLPPSAVLAATLDPSARPRKHLIRVTLPTTAFLDPIQDPLTEDKPPEIPDWYKTLEEQGAVFRMLVEPLHPMAVGEAASSLNDISAAFSTPAGKVPVRTNGTKVEVVHVNQTSVLLQKEQVGCGVLAQLKRAPPSTSSMANLDTGASEDDRIPVLLRDPIAVDMELMKPSKESSSGGKKDVDASKEAGDGSMAISPHSGSGDEGVSGSVTSRGSPSLSGQMDGRGATLSENPTKASEPISASAQIMNILGSYPLSRLGTGSALASSLTSVSSVTVRGSSAGQQSSAKSSVKAVDKDGQLPDGVVSGSASCISTCPSSHASGSGHPTSAAGSRRASKSKSHSVAQKLQQVRCNLTTLFCTALIAFLLGSLVRSLFSPVDFVLLPTGHSNGNLIPDRRLEGADVVSDLTLIQQLSHHLEQQQRSQEQPQRQSDSNPYVPAWFDPAQQVESYLNVLKGMWTHDLERTDQSPQGSQPPHRHVNSNSNGIMATTTTNQIALDQTVAASHVDDSSPIPPTPPPSPPPLPASLATTTKVSWREIKRLFQFGQIWGNWTLVVAVVRR